MARPHILRDSLFRMVWDLSKPAEKPKRNMTKKIVLLLIAAVAIVCGASGCRTAHGAGEDIEAAGQKIQEKTPP